MMSHKLYEFVCLSCDSYEWLNYEFSRYGYTLFCLIYQRVSKLRKSIREEVQTMMKQASKLAALAAATSALSLLTGCQGPVSEAKLARQLSDADVPIDRFLKMVAPRVLGQRLGGHYAIVDGITSIDLPGVVYTKVFSRKTPGATSEHGLVYYLSATSRLNDDQSTPGAALYKITSDLGHVPVLTRIAFFAPHTEDNFTPVFHGRHFESGFLGERSYFIGRGKSVMIEGNAVLGNIFVLLSICGCGKEYFQTMNPFSDSRGFEYCQRGSDGTPRPMLYVFDLDQQTALTEAKGFPEDAFELKPQLVVALTGHEPDDWQSTLHVQLARENEKVVAFVTSGFARLAKAAWIEIATLSHDKPQNLSNQESSSNPFNGDVDAKFRVHDFQDVKVQVVRMGTVPRYLPYSPEGALIVTLPGHENGLDAVTAGVNGKQLFWHRYGHCPLCPDPTVARGVALFSPVEGGTQQFVSQYFVQNGSAYVVAANFKGSGSVELYEFQAPRGQWEVPPYLHLLARFECSRSSVCGGSWTSIVNNQGANRVVLFRAAGDMYAAVPFKWGGAGVFHIDVTAEKEENIFTLVEMKHVSSPLYALEVEAKFPKENFRVNREMRDEILVYDLFLTKFWTKMASKCRENAGKISTLEFRC